MTRQVLEFIQERGGMATCQDVADRFEMDQRAAQIFMQTLRRHSYLESQPVAYKLTPRGTSNIDRTNKTDARRLELLSARRRKLKEDRIELAERLYRQRQAEAIVRNASSIPNSVFAMGAE